MIYTYQISFNGVDYVSLYPTLPVEMSGEWVKDTFIWRESIKELKINKDLNSTVYETLKSYFVDNTKFETQIWVKILKSGVQESLHWFGVKWGEIDHDLTYYKVEPKPYDLYGRYLENFIDRNEYGTPSSVNVNLYNFSSSDYVYKSTVATVAGTFQVELLSDTIKDRIYENGGFAKADIVSEFLWGDNRADGSSAISVNGTHWDYVASDYSVFKHACFGGSTKNWWDLTIKDCFEMLRLFQVYPYFDSNNKLRFEHISKILYYLNLNAISVTPSSYDEQWSYYMPELPVMEKIKMYDDSTTDSAYLDFYGKDIIYSYIRNRIDAINIETTFNYYTNLYNYDADRTLFKNTILLMAGFKNVVMEDWVNSDIGTFSNSHHYFNMAHSTGQFCMSKHFKGYTAFTLNVVASTLTGSMKFGIYKHDTPDALISNEISVTGTGTTTGTLTLTESAPDNCYLRLTSTDDPSTFVGYVTLWDSGQLYFYNPNGPSKLAAALINGHFAIANIQDKYWKDYRLSKSGTMNGSAETFNSSQYNLIRKNIKQYFSTVPDPLEGVDDGTKIGMIKSWTRNLDSGFIDMEIGYQEI